MSLNCNGKACCKLLAHRLLFLGSQAISLDCSHRYPCLPDSTSHPAQGQTGSPLLRPQQFVTFIKAACFAKTPFPTPSHPRFLLFYLCKPCFKGKESSPRPLREGFCDLRTPVADSGEGHRYRRGGSLLELGRLPASRGWGGR